MIVGDALMDKQIKVENLGKNIKYVRENVCNMTQNKFSESVNISIDQLQKIEQGSSLPSVPSLFVIASQAKVPIDLLAKDDIDSSKLYSIIYLMSEIEKYDKTLIESTFEMLIAVYNKMRNEI